MRSYTISCRLSENEKQVVEQFLSEFSDKKNYNELLRTTIFEHIRIMTSGKLISHGRDRRLYGTLYNGMRFLIGDKKRKKKPVIRLTNSERRYQAAVLTLKRESKGGVVYYTWSRYKNEVVYNLYNYDKTKNITKSLGYLLCDQINTKRRGTTYSVRAGGVIIPWTRDERTGAMAPMSLAQVEAKLRETVKKIKLEPLEG